MRYYALMFNTYFVTFHLLMSAERGFHIKQYGFLIVCQSAKRGCYWLALNAGITCLSLNCELVGKGHKSCRLKRQKLLGSSISTETFKFISWFLLFYSIWEVSLAQLCLNECFLIINIPYNTYLFWICLVIGNNTAVVFVSEGWIFILNVTS